MFSSTPLWVGLGLLLLIMIIVVLYNTPRAKAARARRAEEHRRQEEEQKEKVRAKARQMENFRKQRLVVYIREKDGRKSSFEAVFIRALLQKGASVQFLRESDGRAIADGGDTSALKDCLAIVGTSWCRTRSDEFGFNEYVFCDYRLISAADGGVILGAGYENWKPSRSHVEGLANFIIEDLASMVPIK